MLDRAELTTYLAALQEEVELSSSEISALKGFLSQVLLEQIAAHARNLAMPGRIANSTKTESMPGLRAALASLRHWGRRDWDDFFVEISLSEQTLAQDPAGAYSKMEKSAKSDYRRAVAELSGKSGESEAEVARRAIKLTKQSRGGSNARANERRSHVGFYIVGEGREKLEHALGIKDSLFASAKNLVRRWPDGLYVLGIELLMVGLLTAVVMAAEVRVPTFLVVALFLLPAAERAVAIANQLAVMLRKPRGLPKVASI